MFPGSLKVQCNRKNGAMVDYKAPWNDHWVQTMPLRGNEKCLGYFSCRLRATKGLSTVFSAISGACLGHFFVATFKTVSYSSAFCKKNIQGTFIMIAAPVFEELFELFWQLCLSMKGKLGSVET